LNQAREAINDNKGALHIHGNSLPSVQGGRGQMM